MDTNQNDYELHILNQAINLYISKSIQNTEAGLDSLLYRCDELVWEVAIKIYMQSGYQVKFSAIRDIIHSRAQTLKTQLEIEKVEAARRKAEAEKKRIAEEAEAEEKRKQFLISVIKQLEASGRNGSLAELFLQIQSLVCEQLSVHEKEVTLNASFANDLGADELDTPELIILLEEEFDIEISDEDAGMLCTAGGCLDYIHEQLKLKQLSS